MDRKILHSYFSGKANNDEKRIISEWLNEDPSHQEEMIRERKLYDILLFTKQENIAALKQPSPKRTWMIYTMRVAAVALLLIIAGTYFFRDSQTLFAEQTQTISVPPGQRTNIILPDGTKVCLNSNSELRYATFSGKERKVFLKGEAYFDVTRNEHHTFVVETENYNVEVLGTQFNVEAYPDYEFVTSLQSGKVKVTSINEPQHPIILTTGMQAIANNNQMIVRNIANMDLFRWIEGIVSFENAPFHTLMKQFEKSYGVKIIIQNPGINNEFSGKLRVSDGIDHAFRTLQKNTYFTYSRDEEQNIIYIK